MAKDNEQQTMEKYLLSQIDATGLIWLRGG